MSRKNAAQQAAKAAAKAAEAAARAADTAADAEDDDDAADVELGPIFDLKGEKGERHAKTRVYRDEPVDEGYLGDLTPEGTQADIRRRWGGGIFHLEAVDDNGGYLKQLSNVKIAGEPIFDNDLASRKYRKWLSSNFSEAAPAAPAGRTVEEILQLEEARHRRELERIREEAAAAVARSKAEAEARRLDELERQQRQQEWVAAQTKQQQEFMATMTKIQLEGRGQGSELMETLANLALQNLSSGGGASDPVTAFLARGPEILQELRKTGSAIGTQERAQARSAGAAAGGLQITGPLAAKLRRLVAHLQKQGINPEVALDRAMTALLPRPPTRKLARPAARPANGKAAPPAHPPARGNASRKPTKPAAPVA